MKQVVIIHGGDSFLNYQEYLDNLKSSIVEYERLKPEKRWKDIIIETFPDADILTPSMPNKDNAKFEEWKIWFEKITPFFQNDVRLIGHSLGGMFLAKYLHEKPLNSPVRQLILLAAGYDGDVHGYGSFAVESATELEKSAHEIHLFHSKDDFVVPYSELTKFEIDLPSAHVHTFDDRNHFLDADFPELLEVLRQK